MSDQEMPSVEYPVNDRTIIGYDEDGSTYRSDDGGLRWRRAGPYSLRSAWRRVLRWWWWL